MRCFCTVALTLVLLPGHFVRAQLNHHNHKDSLATNLPGFTSPVDLTTKSTFWKASKAPLFLVAAGLFTLTDNDILSRAEVFEEKNENFPKFHHHADDYLQHVPALAVYGLNWVGIKGKNDFANRTMLLLKSELIMATMVLSLKRIAAVPRPDNPSSKTSFPSGHTAQAFATATFLSKEYGQKSIWYSIGAYGVATTVGVMRVMNNRHWVSDVLVGAGIGIFSTNLAYLTHQYKWSNKKRTGQTIVMPSYDGQIGMVSLVHSFN